MSFFWIIFSYFLGSIPFGYLISRFSGKNILKIGWKKSSGSNVFKNVGKWQGILTGVLDISKGYLAVFCAQQIGFSSEIQIFSGTAAVIGHNWSCFLKFSGGRGIGTFIGALLALSPKILFFSLIPLALFALVWNAAVGTLLFLIAAIISAFYLNQFETAGIFTILSLAPILIKRLSPVKEIKNSANKFKLFRNRFIFENDQSLSEFRIKRIFKKIKINSPKSKESIKLPSRGRQEVALLRGLTGPFLLPPKAGWKAAKLGVRIAKKPIVPVKEIVSNGVKKLILRSAEKVVVTEIKTEDFKKMMIASAQKIVLHQEEINKINVFPVADKDTGYNLAATLIGVEGTVSQKNYSTLRELTKDIKEAVMTNARGNAGMIYAGYLIKLLDTVKHLDSIDASHLSLAMKRAIKAARLSIIKPVEGTILDVIKASGEKAYEVAKKEKSKAGGNLGTGNIIKILEEAQKSSETALRETKEKLEVLKKNNVVDAGALGFVKILEAWVENLKGLTPVPVSENDFSLFQPELKEELKQRYEVVAMFGKKGGPQKKELKKEFSSLGDSLEIIESEERIKIHIHTNYPRLIREKLKDFPEAEFRIEDMQKQVKKIKIKPLGLVVEQVADLPKEFLEKYKIEEVSFRVKFPDGEIIASKDEIYPKMRESLKSGRPLPTTSTPTFKEFFSTYQKALEKFEKILVITLCSKLSGAYSSARIARSIFKKPTKLNIFVFDCFTAEVAEGLIAVRAQELISGGKSINKVIEELKEFSPKVTLLACIEDFRYIVRGGRFKLPEIIVKVLGLIQKTGIRPIVSLKKGKVKFLGIKTGKNIAKILAEEVDKRRGGKAIRVAIGHADNLKEAERLKEELEKKESIKVLFVSLVSPVVGVHVGPGALLVAFHPIDQ